MITNTEAVERTREAEWCSDGIYDLLTEVVSSTVLRWCLLLDAKPEGGIRFSLIAVYGCDNCTVPLMEQH